MSRHHAALKLFFVSNPREMSAVTKKIDELARVSDLDSKKRFLDRTAFICLVLAAVAAPHSIAATQGAGITGLLLWVLRLLVVSRDDLRIGSETKLLSLLFIWSVVTAAFSYAPDISVHKLRSVSLFLIFLFVTNMLRSVRAASFLVLVLISSSMVAVIWSPLDRLIGRGVEVHGLNPNSPLLAAIPALGEQPISEGRTVIEVEGVKVASSQALVDEIEKRDESRLKIYHTDYYSTVTVERKRLLDGDTPEERLGIASSNRSHSWRSAGFYGHYVTFAEVIQMLGAVSFGILISLLMSTISKSNINPRKHWKLLAVAVVVVAGFALALLLTSTRASQAGFVAGCASAALLSRNKRIIIAGILVLLPAILLSGFILRDSRKVGFLDSSDNSTTWRMTVYREGLELWTASPRNFLLGVGMDSIQRYSDEWGLFDHGRLPKGHFHSTPLQLAVERGIPALLIWIGFLLVLSRRMFRKCLNLFNESTLTRGLILGLTASLLGFITSGFVHYNLGDSEVATVFYMLMGAGVVLTRDNSR